MNVAHRIHKFRFIFVWMLALPYILPRTNQCEWDLNADCISIIRFLCDRSVIIHMLGRIGRNAHRISHPATVQICLAIQWYFGISFVIYTIRTMRFSQNFISITWNKYSSSVFVVDGSGSGEWQSVPSSNLFMCALWAKTRKWFPVSRKKYFSVVVTLLVVDCIQINIVSKTLLKLVFWCDRAINANF